MDDIKRKKYISMALALLISIALWFYVISGEDPTQTQVYTDIPVEILNTNTLQEKDLTIGSLDAEYISVKIEGKRGVLRSVKKDDIIASIDVAGYTPGEYYADVNIHAPTSVRVAEVNPSQIRLKIENIVTQDKDIQVVFEGTVPEKKEAVCTEMSTQIVSISGAESSVKQVERVTATFDSANITDQPTQMKAALVPVDSSGNPVNDVTVSIKELEITAQLYTVKTVQLEVTSVGTLPDNLELGSIVAPQTVQIAGIDAEVRNIEKVSAVPINLSEITASQDVELILDISGSIRPAKSQNTLTAEVTVNKMDSRSFSYSVNSIHIKGLDEQYDITYDTQSISITAYGKGTSLEEISTQDFGMTIDCSHLGAGTHEVPVEIIISEAAKDKGISTEKSVIKIHIS